MSFITQMALGVRRLKKRTFLVHRSGDYCPPNACIEKSNPAQADSPLRCWACQTEVAHGTARFIQEHYAYVPESNAFIIK